MTQNNFLQKTFNKFMNSRFMQAWEKAAIKRAEHYISRSTYNQLNQLTDKELRDIGIHRGDIWDISVNGSSGRYYKS